MNIVKQLVANKNIVSTSGYVANPSVMGGDIIYRDEKHYGAPNKPHDKTRMLKCGFIDESYNVSNITPITSNNEYFLSDSRFFIYRNKKYVSITKALFVENRYYKTYIDIYDFNQKCFISDFKPLRLQVMEKNHIFFTYKDDLFFVYSISNKYNVVYKVHNNWDIDLYNITSYKTRIDENISGRLRHTSNFVLINDYYYAVVHFSRVNYFSHIYNIGFLKMRAEPPFDIVSISNIGFFIYPDIRNIFIFPSSLEVSTKGFIVGFGHNDPRSIYFLEIPFILVEEHLRSDLRFCPPFEISKPEL